MKPRAKKKKLKKRFPYSYVEYICKWSDNKIKKVQEKYIKENWGK